MEFAGDLESFSRLKGKVRVSANIPKSRDDPSQTSMRTSKFQSGFDLPSQPLPPDVPMLEEKMGVLYLMRRRHQVAERSEGCGNMSSTLAIEDEDFYQMAPTMCQARSTLF